jgi:CubicO group peptidase (beta-lactamase class C family)
MTSPVRSLTRALLPALLVLASSAGRAQDPEEFVRAEMERQRIPGLALAVLKNGEVVHVRGYGVSNVKTETPITPETVFKIGSVSKQFIATGIMVLVQAGQMRVTDSIHRFFPDAPAAWRPITVRHLLTHTGGLIRESPAFAPMIVQSDSVVIRAAYASPLRFVPGTKYEYSNLGYFILADIIRRVSGQPWPAFLRDKAFVPAGMMATRTTAVRDSLPGLATGYMDNDAWRIAPDWPAVRPSGAFVSTVLDLAKWDAVLYSNRVLADSTRQQMWTPVRLNDGSTHAYGFGWELTPMNAKRRTVHHGGTLTGFRSHFTRFPDDGLSIIVLMNIEDVDIAAFVRGIASIYLRD